MRENEKVKREQGGREERGREEGRESARTSGDNEIEEVKERERERNTHTHTHAHTHLAAALDSSRAELYVTLRGCKPYGMPTRLKSQYYDDVTQYV